MLDYHLTFLVVSGALLGVAGGGAAAAVLDARVHRPSAGWLSFGAAVSAVVALAIESHLDPLTLGMFTAAGAAYVLGVIPVLLASWVIVRMLRETPTASGTLYAADLAGAAAGALFGYLAIGTVGGQGLYGVVAAASLLAALAFVSGSGSRVLISGLALASVTLIVGLSLWGEAIAPPRPGPFKVPEMGRPHEFARWDPLARVDIARIGLDGDPVHYAFLIDERYAGPRPASLQMTLDMGAQTPIIAAARADDLAVFDASILAAPYVIAPRSSVLVVGPGGGIDVVNALRQGATFVTAVEVNRTEVALMRGSYAEYSGGLYLDPRVHVYEDEARSFIRRSREQQDLIAITVVDSYAALSAGAYALTENYLYTTEAMADYLTHLSPGGVVAISRWYLEPPAEIARTVGIAISALRQLGHDHPERSIAVLRLRSLGLVMVRAEPFTVADMQRLRAFADEHSFAIVMDPAAPSPLLELARADAPPTDDRPFFFDSVSFGDIIDGRARAPYGYLVLVTTLVLSTALAFLLALLPVYRRARVAGGRIVPPGTTVALSLGAGFIAAELVLLQRLTLYLGQPSLALSVGIASLLGGAALGSAVSSRVPGGIRSAALVSAAILLAVLGGLPVLTDATLAAALEARVAIAALAAGAVGLPLGTIFPRLIELVREPALVSWVWAVNGSSSVVGATLSTAIALGGGFSALGLVAVGFYVIAALPRDGS